MATPKLTPDQKAAKKAAREHANSQARGEGRQTEIERINREAMTHPDQVRPEGLATRSRDTVIVACKIAVPYVDLRLFRPETLQQQTQTGTREVVEYRATGEVIRIRGTAYPRGTPPDGFPERPQLVHDAALTFNVPHHLWAIWMQQNQKNPLYTNHLIFGDHDIASVRAWAKEHSDQKSGLEPLDPRKNAAGKNTDPRVPQPTNASLSPVETESERATRQRNVQTVAESFDDADV